MATKPSRATRPAKKPDKKDEKKKLVKKKNDDSDDDDDDDDRPNKGPALKGLKAPKWKPKMGHGFRATFEMPFRLKDILRELCKPEHPLGFDAESATVSVVRPGSNHDKVVRGRRAPTRSRACHGRGLGGAAP